VAKTIKQLADELGVSKQTIRYHIKSLPVKTATKKIFTGKQKRARKRAIKAFRPIRTDLS
jgi:predicted ArsR family transcriptional regulator